MKVPCLVVRRTLYNKKDHCFRYILVHICEFQLTVIPTMQTIINVKEKLRANITTAVIICLCTGLFLHQAIKCLETYMSGETLINLENVR